MPFKITITPRGSNGAEFDIFVETKQGRTEHVVTVKDEYYKGLTRERITKLELLKWSFGFLLEREPNTSILKEFDLPVISQYFSEYEQEAKKYAQSAEMRSGGK